MMHDFFLYAKLKFRLFKASLLNILSLILFSDLSKEKGTGERLYQVYACGIWCVWLILMWVFVLDFISALFLGLGPQITQIVVEFFSLLSPVLLVALCFAYTRSSPWKMSQADIAFTTTGSLRTESIILFEVTRDGARWGVAAFVLGFLLGIAFQSGTGIPVNPFLWGAITALMVFCSVVGAWVIGCIRLTLSSNRARPYSFMIYGILVLAAIALLWVFLQGAGLLQVVSFPSVVIACIPLLCAGLFALLKAASRIDMAKVVSENRTYAALYRFHKLSLYDPSGYASLARKIKVAQRRPIFSLGSAVGGGALIEKSLLSHLRQFGYIPRILVWAAIAAPLTALLLLSPQVPLFWMFWVQILLLLHNGLDEITRVFREDYGHRFVSDHLGFTTMKLFVCSSLPGLALCMITSCISVFLVFGSGESVILALVISVLVNIALWLSAGIDGLNLFTTNITLIYEGAALIFAIGVFLSALTGLLWPTVIFLLVYAALLASVIRSN